jgi:ABC-type sugar transport system permease subunit
MPALRCRIYLPNVLVAVATIVIWSWVFNPTFGPINVIPSIVDDVRDPIVRTFSDYGTRHWPVLARLASGLWYTPAAVCIRGHVAGGSLFISLATLPGTDPDAPAVALYDGANRRRRILNIGKLP